MSIEPCGKVSVFKEAAMQEVDSPKITPSSCMYTGPQHIVCTTDIQIAYSTQEIKRLSQPAFNHKPVALRSVSLLSLLAITLALIGALQYAVVHLQDGATPLAPQRSDSANVRRDFKILVPRNGANSKGVSVSSTAARASSTSSVVETSANAGSSSTRSHDASQKATHSSEKPTTNSAKVESTHVTQQTQTPSVQTSSSSLPSSGPVPTFGDTSDTAPLNQQSTSSGPVTPVTHIQDTTAYVPTATTSRIVFNTASTAYVSTHITQSRPIQSGTAGKNNDGNQGTNNRNDTNGILPGSGGNENKGTVAYQVWGSSETFLGTYLAILIAVVYRILWTMVYNGFNLIDPFWQLMQPNGALAENAFFAFYQAQSNLLGPIAALLRRRWVLASIAVTYLVACLLPALASESIFVVTDWQCSNPDLSNTHNPCPPKVVANFAILKLLQGLLAFACVILLLLTSLLLCTKTGLPSDPRSIATVASLMRHPSLVEDLNEAPVAVTPKHMESIFSGKRYRLAFYTSANGGNGYGIIPANDYAEHSNPMLSNSNGYQYTPVDGSLPFSDRNMASTFRFIVTDGVLVLTVLGTFSVIIAYYLDHSSSGFNNFFNSSTFGPRFILTLAGTVIAGLWKSTEKTSVVMAPYSRLAERSSSPHSTLLFTPSCTPISTTIRTLHHRYFSTAAITAVTFLGEGLNIVISGIPYAKGETLMQFSVSMYMSIGILGTMIVAIGFLILSRIREPRIPRRPDTLGAVMSYLSGSRILDDYEGMECLDERTRHGHLRLMGKKYEFKEMIRRDGKFGWAVDETFGQSMYHS